MSYHYENNEYTDMLLVYGECYENAEAASQRYAELFPKRITPPPQIFVSLLQRVRETGSLQPNPDFPNGDTSESNHTFTEEDISQMIKENPQISMRQLCRLTKTSYSVVQRALKDIELNTIRSEETLALSPDYFSARTTFCMWLLDKFAENKLFSCDILFTDEVSFTSNGVLCLNNIQEWSTEDQPSFYVNIWAGIVDNSIVGPFVLPDYLDGENYLSFLQENMDSLLENVPLSVRQRMWFMHNGEPPYFLPSVREHLNAEFPDKWIGNQGSVVWPARSNDLNPLHFYFWEYLKNLVYTEPIHTVDDLRDRIIGSSNFISQQTSQIEQIRDSMIRRAHLCIEMGGGSFEHLL